MLKPTLNEKIKLQLCWAVIVLSLFINSCTGFYYLENPYTLRKMSQTYLFGDMISVKVNPLKSIETRIPVSYYSLPYCRPMEGIRMSVMNLGQLLMGDRIENSPYRFRMNVNETNFLCGKDPLTAAEVRLLKQKIRDQYQVNMILDNLPVTMLYTLGSRLIGFPLGYTDPITMNDYIYNHLKFRVFVHDRAGENLGLFMEGDESKAFGFEVVGFEVVPCSVKYSPEDMTKLNMYENVHINCPWWQLDEDSQIIKENETVAFTYEVEFIKSDDRWPYDFDKGNAEIGLLTIIDIVIAMFILTAMVFALYWIVTREQKRCEKLDVEPQGKPSKELPGWILVVGDVFREPGHAKLLCVMVGEGVQITATALAAIVYNSLGFVSPDSRGMLLLSLIMLYLFFSIVGGYAAVRLWKTIKNSSEGWKSVSLYVACFFPGMFFVFLMLSNILLSGTNSTRSVSISSFISLISLWCISVSLTLMGGFIGTKTKLIPYPVPLNQVSRQIPTQNFLSWMLMLVAGYIPFNILTTESSRLLLSIWRESSYPAFGALLFVLVAVVVICGQLSVGLTWSRLRSEDWRWWWKSFFVTGTAGICVFFNSIIYLIFNLNGLNSPTSAALYTGYSLVVAIAVMLATGSIGFIVSFYFVHYLYSSSKIISRL